MDRWRHDVRIADRGFNHAYDSVVEEGNGEDFFLALVDEAVGRGNDVLDVGCGHGDLTLELAARCRSIVGVDRTAGYVELARELAAERGVANARFEVAELAGPEEDRAGGPLPVADASIDLVIDRRGPALARFLDDLLGRVARPGAVILGMHPAGGPPAPSWAEELATFRHRFDAIAAAVVESWVTEPARRRGLEALRLWWCDVPEHLPSPRALYDRLRFDGAPAFRDVEAELGRVFDRHATALGVALRHQRLVFRLELP